MQRPSQPRTAIAPRVGFVSLGCPEGAGRLRADPHAAARRGLRDLAHLRRRRPGRRQHLRLHRRRGRGIARRHRRGAGGERQGHRHRLPGRQGRRRFVRDAHPKVLAVTGPHATQEVMSAVHAHLPQAARPVRRPGAAAGHQAHADALRLSQDHRRLQPPLHVLHHPVDARRPGVSRPIGEVMQEAENLVKAGVKELLVISQDTSAYGVDVKYRTGFWQGRPLKTRMTELAKALGELGVWVRLHYVYPYPHVDEVDPADGRGQAAALPRRAVPAREPAHPEADEAPGQRGEHAGAHPRLARDLPGHHDPQHVHRRLSRRDRRPSSRSCSRSSTRRSSTASAASPIRRSKAPRPTRCPIRCRRRCARSGRRASCRRRRASARRGSQRKVGTTIDVLVDAVDGDTAIARSQRRRAGDRRHRPHCRRRRAARRRVRPRDRHGGIRSRPARAHRRLAVPAGAP